MSKFKFKNEHPTKLGKYFNLQLKVKNFSGLMNLNENSSFRLDQLTIKSASDTHLTYVRSHEFDKIEIHLCKRNVLKI